MAKVSVVVPIYNVEKYLERCLMSLVNQTFSDIEIILVDDGSADNSYEIAKKFANKDKRIKLYRQTNKGLSGARNTGLKYVTSDYLMFLDSDDYFANNIIELCYEKITLEDSDIAIFSFDKIDENNQLIERVEAKRDNTIKICDDKKILTDIENCVWDKIYRTELFKDILFPEGYFYEDFGTTFRLFARASKVSFVDSVGLYYLNERKGSITKTFDKRIYSIFNMCDLIVDYYDKLKLYVEYKNEIDILICREVIECIKKAIFESKNNKILRDKFINDAYDYLGKKCNKIIYNKGQKPYIYKNKLFLKIYIMIKGK